MATWESDELAATWVRVAEARNRMMAPATERMFALAGIAEGMQVLDLGAGAGDTALMLAQRVGATGSVLATDLSAQMVRATVEAARVAGAGNVSAQVMNAAALDLPAGSFDAAVARNSIMFIDDLGAALRGVHRVLRHGGRFATITWAEWANNPFNSILNEAVRRHGRLPDKAPELVRAFSLTDPEALRQAFGRAGFDGVAVERVQGIRAFPSLEGAMKPFGEVLYREFMSAMTAQERERALADVRRGFAAFVAENGTCSFPIESLVVAGST
jgi:ubiquinone/menaquinone biosynthesis C-methylase UbiE